MKIRKQSGPPRKKLGDLKNGALFERADIETPCTTYMVCKHDRTVTVNVNDDRLGNCTYVVDLKNASYKAFEDNMDVVPLEQDDEIVVREL